MDRTLPLFAIGLVFGGGIGFAIAAGNGITFDGHDHDDPAHHGAAHAITHEAVLDLAASGAPSVDAVVTPDPMAGYNLHVMTQNFAFSPKNASGEHVTGEGHAHVYANGVKLGRLYANWMHIDSLPKGNVTIEVTLNSNDHRPLAVDGALISARTVLDVE